MAGYSESCQVNALVPAFSKRSISRPGSRLFLGYPVLYTRRFEAGETSIPGVSQVSEKRFQLAEPYGAKLGDPAQRHPICNFPHRSDSSITDMIQTTTR